VQRTYHVLGRELVMLQVVVAVALAVLPMLMVIIVIIPRAVRLPVMLALLILATLAMLAVLAPLLAMLVWLAVLLVWLLHRVLALTLGEPGYGITTEASTHPTIIMFGMQIDYNLCNKALHETQAELTEVSTAHLGQCEGGVGHRPRGVRHVLRITR
jgi:hypothetical protein